MEIVHNGSKSCLNNVVIRVKKEDHKSLMRIPYNLDMNDVLLSLNTVDNVKSFSCPPYSDLMTSIQNVAKFTYVLLQIEVNVKFSSLPYLC